MSADGTLAQSPPRLPWLELAALYGPQPARYMTRAYTRRKCARCGEMHSHLILADQVQFARRFYCGGGAEYDKRAKRWVVRVCYLCWLRYLATGVFWHAKPLPPPSHADRPPLTRAATNDERKTRDEA